MSKGAKPLEVVSTSTVPKARYLTRRFILRVTGTALHLRGTFPDPVSVAKQGCWEDALEYDCLDLNDVSLSAEFSMTVDSRSSISCFPISAMTDPLAPVRSAQTDR
jgi:hypothetical protein